MKIQGRTLLAWCGAWLLLILSTGSLVSCTSAPSATNAPSLSTIRVVMDNSYPPYVFADDQGKVQGILVDQWKLWEDRTGAKVDLTAVPWSEALQRMKAGEFDVIDTIFYTDERAQIFDFTDAYAKIDVPIFFQKNITGIADAGDLKGFRVAVKAGDANADYLVQQGITDLVYYDSYEAIIQAAARKEQVIFVIDQPPALYFIYKYGIQDQFNQSAPLYSGEFHRAVRKDNPALLSLVTTGFSAISVADYRTIDQRWLGTGEPNNWQPVIPYALAIIGVVLLVILVLIVFSRTLQQRVGQRTRELEETAAALHDNRRFLADLIEYGGALIFVKDRDGRYELINRKWEEVIGLKREADIGKTDEVLFPGPIGQQFRTNDMEVIDTGTVLEREEILEDARGQRHFISIKFPVRGDDGRIKGVCGMSTEITERKEAEEAVRESKERLRTVTENAPDTILQVNRDGIIQFISRPVPGLTREQVIGSSVFQWVPPEQYPVLANTLEAVFSDGQRGDYESLGPGPHGEPRTYHVRVAPVMLDGQVDSAIYIASDITERKRVEEALRQSEDKFSKAFHSSPDSVNINRLSDGLYLEINDGFTAITGYTAADVTGKTSLEINIWAGPADRARLVQGLREHGQVINLEAQFRLKDGRLITALMSAAIIEVAGEKCILSITRDITERKQAEEALRNSEERYQNFISQSFEGISRTEFDHPIDVTLPMETQIDLIYANAYMAECNQALADMYHLPSVNDLVGARLIEAHGGKENPVNRAAFRKLIENGYKSIGDETVEYRADGEQVWFLSNTVGTVENGYLVRLWGTALDITERKQADAALKGSELKMRAIVDAAPFGAHLYELEPDGRLVFKGANQSADQILHVDHQQFIGKTIEEAFPLLIETEVPAAYRQVAATGERYQLDQIAYDDSGISGVFELHAFQTGPRQMAVFFRDVTERKQMEDALRISLEKYRVLFESFPLGVSITDSAGKILESNLEAEKLLGLPKAEHERRTYFAPEWNLLRSDGTPMPVEEYAAARALQENRLVQNVEMGLVKGEGAITWLSVTAAPIPLKGYGVAIAYGDITRHKEIEDEIRRLNEDLELRGLDRTRELAAANARLTELDQLKSKFVSDVSHELRTPIANLKLYIDLLERGKPDKQAQYIQVLHQQVRRVAALVDDILDLSRLERRKEQGVIYRAVALNEVVDQVVLAHQPRAEADGLLLTFEPASSLPPVRADANQLAQVVTNLIVNALSYTSTGAVRIRTYSKHDQVWLCVADSGSGIAPDDLPHVFERFYRGQHVLKNDVPGTGLGLAIVKEIVDLHEGRIEVDSQLGHGTTFRVWLPVV
jgi:PAS domain S-box-containing protein